MLDQADKLSGVVPMALDPGHLVVSDIDNDQTLETQTQATTNQTDGEQQSNEKLQDIWMSELDDSLFEVNETRPKLTQKQKRKNYQRHKGVPEDLSSLTDLSKEQLRTLQKAGNTLEKIRQVVSTNPDGTSQQFYERDGLLYRRWRPPHHCSDGMEVEQLILPVQCRSGVLQLAHTIPLAGHLGKDKTTQRILQWFYWLTLYKDVEDYCHSCVTCQKSSRQHGPRAPLMPLPVLSEPFKRIVMDIIGPLPRSRSGKRYVLVICDYATRYPEPIPLHSTDASHIAEELIGVFAKMGIPSEILTDQGSNFVTAPNRIISNVTHSSNQDHTLPSTNRWFGRKIQPDIEKYAPESCNTRGMRLG